MTFLGALISIIFSGLIIGAFARLALPGRDPMSIPMTIGIGVAGSFVGGMIAVAIGASLATAILLQIACAALIVYFVRRSRGGGLTDPGARTH